MQGLGQRIEPPARGAVRRGLIAAAPTLVLPAPAAEQDNPEGSEPWLGGIVFEGDTCDTLEPRPILCADLGDKPDQGSDGVPSWHPYYLLGADRCSTMDRGRDRVGNARRNLLATQSHQVEAEVWDGVASLEALAQGDDVNPFLADGHATILETAAVPYTQALAWLDHALAECLHGAQGMIHGTVFTVNLWQAAGLLREEGGRLFTVSDNIVVAGSGYSGSAPATDPPDEPDPIPPADIAAAAYAYATGLVYVALGREDRIGGTESAEIARDSNDQITRVERPAIAIWGPCCQIGLNVDHTTESGAVPGQG